MKEYPAGPTGTIQYTQDSKELFDKALPSKVFLRVSSGRHMFWLERDEEFNVNYYYSSPGTGTRVASIDLNTIMQLNDIFIIFKWSPDEISLKIGPSFKNHKLITSKGKPSPLQFQVGEDGLIYRIGEEKDGITRTTKSFYLNGKYILQPTALDAWQDTIKAIDVLATGKSNKGYEYEMVVANLTLSILVTGFEAYLKKRFLELEKEGIVPDINAINKSFYTSPERDTDMPVVDRDNAIKKDITVLQYIVLDKRKINFQDFKICNRAYSKAYSIKFSELGLLNEMLEDLKRFIQYRHKIIHVSPSIYILNQEKVPPEELVSPSFELAKKAENCFVEFIDKLHQATLKLR